MPRTGATAIAVAATLLFDTRDAAACAVCFGPGESGMLQGTALGMLALLAVTLTVLAAFAAFFVQLARRAAQVEDDA
ncbi:MAG: hypothetical protein AB7Q29_01725 [Vicinamibacterales bacterium]